MASIGQICEGVGTDDHLSDAFLVGRWCNRPAGIQLFDCQTPGHRDSSQASSKSLSLLRIPYSGPGKDCLPHELGNSTASSVSKNTRGRKEAMSTDLRGPPARGERPTRSGRPEYRGLTDLELVAAVDTDLEAFGELIRRHQDFVYGAAMRIVREPGAGTRRGTGCIREGL